MYCNALSTLAKDTDQDDDDDDDNDDDNDDDGDDTILPNRKILLSLVTNPILTLETFFLPQVTIHEIEVNDLAMDQQFKQVQ